MFKTAGLLIIAAGFTAVAAALGDELLLGPVQTRQQIHGSFFGPQLLTEEEQSAYRARIRSAKSPEEMANIRDAHDQLMKARAREKGLVLPEKKPATVAGNIFSPQLMTEEERAAYRAKIRNAKTKETIDKIRAEHHEELESRAREKSVVPADVPTFKENIVPSVAVTPSKNAPSSEATPGERDVQSAPAISRERDVTAVAVSSGENAALSVPVSPGRVLSDAVFGPVVMTEEEQAAYRAKLRAAKSQEEREIIRVEHRRLFYSRAREKGVAVP